MPSIHLSNRIRIFLAVIPLTVAVALAALILMDSQRAHTPTNPVPQPEPMAERQQPTRSPTQAPATPASTRPAAPTRDRTAVPKPSPTAAPTPTPYETAVIQFHQCITTNQPFVDHLTAQMVAIGDSPETARTMIAAMSQSQELTTLFYSSVTGNQDVPPSCSPSDPPPTHRDLTTSPLYAAAACATHHPSFYNALTTDSTAPQQQMDINPDSRALLLTVFLHTQLSPQEADALAFALYNLCQTPDPGQ